MRKTLKLAVMAICCSTAALAQEPVDSTAYDL